MLFICKYNRFRSKIAEARLKAVCPGVLVRSRGIIEGKMNHDVEELRACDNFGLNIRSAPRGVSYSDLEWADYVVVVASDVPKSLFKLKGFSYKLVSFDIDDVCPDYSVADVEKVVRKVLKATDLFCEGLGKV